MIEVAEFFMEQLGAILDMFARDGGYIGMFIVCMPVLSWIVRAIRSIISKK